MMSLNNYFSRFKKYFRANCFLDLDNNLKNTVLISGMGRSGTTWIANLININNSYRYIFEPFHPYYNKNLSGFNFHEYIPENYSNKLLINHFESILKGKYKNRRSDILNKKIVSQKRLIKDINSILYIKWLYNNFPELKIIIIIRHPCAVALSKLNLQNWNWQTHPSDFLKQPLLLNDFLYPFVNEIPKASSYFQKQVLIWCMVHYVVLKQIQNSTIYLAYYEKFRNNPLDELQKVFTFLGYDNLFNLNKDKYFKKINTLSQVSYNKKRKIITSTNTWLKNINKNQLEYSQNLLYKFGLDKLYNDDNIYIKNNIEK